MIRLLLLLLAFTPFLAAEEKVPQYLYKVISVENWQASTSLGHVKLTSEDGEFIHLSTVDQLDRIIGKYWASVPEFVVLKLDTSKLLGKLVYEKNPGGENKYYHLYDGTIPLDSVIESTTRKKVSV